jgi:hypothetical protein
MHVAATASATVEGGAFVGLHWWTAATSRPIEDIAYVLGDLGPLESPGAYGQPSFRVHESGTRVYCGSSRPGQPIVINAPGEVCEGWADQLLGWTDTLDAWCTRYDLACDLEPASVARRRLREMDSSFKRGRCETSIRSREYIESDTGHTLYLGGKSSPLRLRAYDQRGPLRIEWQHRPVHRDVGECVAGRLLRKGLAESWRTLARAVTFPMPWYRELLSGSAEILPNLVRVDASFEDAVMQLRKQWGGVLWALQGVGLGLDDLAVAPVALRGSQAAKYRSWAASAERAGYDVSAFREHVERLCPKSK